MSEKGPKVMLCADIILNNVHFSSNMLGVKQSAMGMFLLHDKRE